MDKASIRKQFLLLENLSDSGCNGVREEVEEYLEEFLRAGIKPRSIMNLLGDKGVFYNYDILTKYQVCIDLTELAKELGGDFVYENLEGFLTKVDDVDDFLNDIYDKDSFCELCEKNSYENVFFEMLRLGADANTLFYLTDIFLKELAEDPGILIDAINSLIGYGLDREYAENWLIVTHRADLIDKLS